MNDKINHAYLIGRLETILKYLPDHLVKANLLDASKSDQAAAFINDLVKNAVECSKRH